MCGSSCTSLSGQARTQPPTRPSVHPPVLPPSTQAVWDHPCQVSGCRGRRQRALGRFCVQFCFKLFFTFLFESSMYCFLMVKAVCARGHSGSLLPASSQAHRRFVESRVSH